MNRKRGPNSPMESEKTKQSTSAAASTLGMAAMLNVVTSVFGNSEARSEITDSEDEFSQAIGEDNPWNEANVSNSTIKQPKDNGDLKPLFEYKHDGAIRDEIEIEILTKNGRKFTGSITPIEAKYDIYLKALNFENHDNFDGVRINYKGKLVVTFKLIEPINIDDLQGYENFEFKRTWTANGKKGEDTIGCKNRDIIFKALWEKNNRTWVPEKSLGIITPWRAQIAQIRSVLEEMHLDPNDITVDTVERYQGGARDVIIISTCTHTAWQLRTLLNISSEGVDRKLNVALTRAREHLIMLGNPEILQHDEHYAIFMAEYGVKDWTSLS